MLQVSAYTTATATQDLIRVWDLNHSSRQYQILNPLIEARYQSHIFMDPSQVISTEPWWEFLENIFFNGRILGIWKFLRQELDQSRSCGNTGSFNPLLQAGHQTLASIVTWSTAVGFLTHQALTETPKREILRRPTSWSFLGLGSCCYDLDIKKKHHLRWWGVRHMLILPH